MISFSVYTDDDKQIKEVLLTGHAGFAEHGSDIVCAAVSSQVISIENSLHQLLNIACHVEVDEIEGGYLKLTLPNIRSSEQMHDAQLLLRHLVFAMEIIANNYPKFVQIWRQPYKS